MANVAEQVIRQEKKSLGFYVTYDGILDPLGQSQILPYIKGLASEGYCFIVVSFEKVERTPYQLEHLQQEFGTLGIRWIVLPFKHGRFEYIKRIMKGAWLLRRLARSHKPALIHARTILPASMVVLAGLKIPLIYDIRAFAGEWIDAGRLKRGGLQARLFQWLEEHLIRTAAGLVVLDQSGAEYLRQAYPLLRVPMKVIPTCTNLDAFLPQGPTVPADPTTSYRFVFLGGARFPYRPDLALLLIRQLLAQGFDSTIDFINERDHEVIKAACSALDFPVDRCRIFSLPQCEVPAALVRYHSGFVFNTSGSWRSMSSPTKLGEYLGAGLHVVGLSGIHGLDRLAAEDPAVVDVFRETELTAGLSTSRIVKLLTHQQASTRAERARRLALKHYDITIALRNYSCLYRDVLATNL
jgi:hypothetical protein